MAAKKTVCSVLMFLPLLIAGLVFVPSSYSDEKKETVEDLMFLQMPNVTTASKSEESVANAPSVVTVWTADDIQKMGARSLKELFERTAGFFCTRQYGAAVFGSHGLIADTNTAFLFLIDGHSINSIAVDGPSNYWYLPSLDKVKQVEIVRGPGSTLWGTDAAMATINIITKDGSDINGLQASVDASSNDGQHTGQILYGKNYGENKSVMASFSISAENGFPNGQGATIYPNGYQWAENQKLNPPSATIAPLDEMPNSYEFHVKAKMDNITISAHASDVLSTDLWQQNSNPSQQYFQRRETTYVEVADDEKLSDSLSLTTKVFTDYLVSDDHMYNDITAPALWNNGTGVDEEVLSKEQKIGIDMLFTQKFKDVDNLKYGVRGVMTNLDPGITYQGVTFNAGTVALQYLPADYDKDFAAFVENDWKAADKLDIVLGFRADNDNLLQDGTACLPRASGIYTFDQSSTLKYCYNTGFVRPEAGYGYLGQTPEKYLPAAQWQNGDPVELKNGGNYDQVGANKAEQIYTNDLVYMYNTKTFAGSIDFYQTLLKNYFNYSGALTPAGSLTPDGLPDRLVTVNANNITSVGVEIDAKKKFNGFDLYGNVSQIFSSQVNSFVWQLGNYTTTLQGGSLYDNNLNCCAFPYTTFNLGTDIDLSKDICLNVHVNGWGNGYMVKLPATNSASTNGVYETIPFSSIVDVNVLFKNLLGSKALTGSVFVKNLLNNDTAEVPMVDAGGYYYYEGFSAGAKLSYKFGI